MNVIVPYMIRAMYILYIPCIYYIYIYILYRTRKHGPLEDDLSPGGVQVLSLTYPVYEVLLKSLKDLSLINTEPLWEVCR